MCGEFVLYIYILMGCFKCMISIILNDLNILYKGKSPPSRMSALDKKFISIEGNIGSGKSTILKIIRENFPSLTILDEPLSSWEKIGDQQDVNLLGMYYQDPKRWGFTFQIYALFTRLKKWGEYTSMNDQSIKISERSLLSDRYVFANIMRDMEFLNEAEYEIYLQCYRDMSKMKKISDVKGIIYIQCDPKTCSQRIKKRNREGESTIPLDYLEKLHEKHEEWLNFYSKSLSQTNQTCKSNSSANLSDEDKNSDHHSEQYESNHFENIQKNKSFSELKDLQYSDNKFSLFSNLQINQITPKKKSICFSFDPHSASPSLHKKNLFEYTPQNKYAYDYGKTAQDQKVLIIDNSLPIDKEEIVSQIQRWMKTVF